MVETSILAMFGKSSSKYSVSQKLFSKLTSISPGKIQDSLQNNVQKIAQIGKSWAPLFSNQKRNVGSSQWLKKLVDLNYKTYLLNQ